MSGKTEIFELSSSQRRRRIRGLVNDDYAQFMAASSNAQILLESAAVEMVETLQYEETLHFEEFERFFFDESNDSRDLATDDDDEDVANDDENYQEHDSIEPMDILKLRLNSIILRHHVSDRAVEDILSALREFGLELPKTKKKFNEAQYYKMSCTDP